LEGFVELMVLEGAAEFIIFEVGLILSLNIAYQYILYIKKIKLHYAFFLAIGFLIGILSYFISDFIRDAT
jgi:hypothetical protein